MSNPSHHPESDRNLLFGILAVQLNFISRDDLLSGMSTWVLHKDQPIGAILREQGKLSADQLATLDALLVQYLKTYGDDIERGIKACPGASTLAAWLTPIDDPDVQSSVARLRDDAETADYLPRATSSSRYRKLRVHDDGGQGIVWLAEDTELHRQVALKEMKPKHADVPEARGRFVHEAQVTGTLEHPGVVPIHDMGRDSAGRPHYVMRFLSGGPLSEQIREFHAADARPGRDAGERSLALRKLLRRFIDVCNTVAYAHSRGVLHRDLKPKNVMLGKFGETLVIDWGMTKTGVETRRAESPSDEPPVAVSTDGDLDETLPGMLKGTIPYMSPEQALGRTDLAATSDVYSLGAILYDILTGRRAYASEQKDEHKKRAEILGKVQKGQFAPPIEVKPGTPPALDAVCRKAMAFAMKDRYASALDLASDIEHWLADEPVSAYREPLTARAGRWTRRHQKTVVGVVVASLVASIALGVSTALVSAEQRETEKQRIVVREENQQAFRACGVFSKNYLIDS